MTSTNIYNAFYVVKKTYDNIHKLMEYCGANGQTESHYVQAVPKFLRYKSDNDVQGWFIKNFIMLFQDVQDPELENGWRNGSVYILEIELYDEEGTDLPLVHLSKYDYKDIENWSAGCSPTNHWRFSDPRHNHDALHIKEKDAYLYATAKNMETCDQNYWGLRTIRSTHFSLLDLASNNAIEKVFGGFEKLDKAKAL